MQKNLYLHKFIFTIIILTTYFFNYQIHASSLDGTSSIIYKTIPHVFHNGEFSKGFVALKKGFTVTADSGVRLKMESPVSLGMDLKTTGSIILENNLRLDSGFTLSSSGTICGNGYSLILEDDLIIPEMSTIKITSSLTIEGNGHTIFFDSFAQLLTDSHSTLTLRNLILKNVSNTSSKPPISTNGTTSKITLDNVQFALNDNFYFNTGSLFFHNDVLFSGENLFVYRSKQPSYITPKSTLGFDVGSTLFYSPEDSNQNLIIPQDESSTLLFDGATLRTTPTGMQLSNGKILFENQSNIDAGTTISSPSFTIQDINNSLNYKSVDWDFSGIFLATGGWTTGTTNSDQVKIYALDENSLNLNLVNGLEFGTYTSTVYASSWSPDGKYLAIAGSGARSGFGGFDNRDNLRIYQFNTATFTLTPMVSVDFGITSTIYSVDWGGIDDYYIAIGGSGALAVGNFDNTHNLRIYHFDKNNINLEPIASYDSGNIVKTAKWNFSGAYLAFGGRENETTCNLNLLYFDPMQTTQANRLQLKDTQIFPIAASDSLINYVDWNSDSKYLALGGINSSDNKSIRIYEFNPISETFSLIAYVSDKRIDAVIFVSYIKWSPNNEYLAYGGEDPSYGGDHSAFLSFNPNLDLKLNYLGYAQIRSMSGSWNPTKLNLFASGGKPRFKSYFSHLNESNLNVSLFNQGSITISDNQPFTNTYNTYDGVYSVDWKNDGSYIAVGGQGAAPCGGFSNTNEIRIYRFNKISEKIEAITSQKYGTRVYVTSWSPNGKYLAVGGKGAISGGGFLNTDQVRIYEFKNDNLYPITSVSLGTNATLFSMKWHPSGNFLALGSYNAGAVGTFPSGNNLRIYSFDGTALTEVTSLNPTYAVMGVDWSHDGKYIAIGTFNCPSDYPDNPDSHNVYNPGKLRIYEFQNYSALTQKAIYPSTSASMGFFGISWGPDNRYIAANYTAIGGSGYSGSRTTAFYFNGTDIIKFQDWSGSSDVAGISEVKISPDGQNAASAYLRGQWPWKNSGLLFVSDFFKNLFGQKFNLGFTPFTGNFQTWSVSWNPTGKYLAAGYFNLENSGVPQIVIYRINNKTNITRTDYNGLELGKYVDINVLSGAMVNINGIVNYAK